MIRSIRDIFQLFRILYVIIKHNLSFKPLPIRLIYIIKELGPIYIKFGQTLSTRPDLIGETYASALQELQDRLPPCNIRDIKNIIKQTLHKDITELFASFDDAPLAAASIAQVHNAITKCGKHVAVKVLRPDIHKNYSRDIELLYFLARLLPRFSSKLRRLKMLDVVSVFEQTMKYELDLRLEAAACVELARNNISNDIYIPEVFWQLTSHEVLTTEFIEGISIYNKNAILASGLDPAELSRKIAVMFFNQAYRDGFFHADLHPGNILVTSSGRIALLDFGIMGRLKEGDRLAIAGILKSFLDRDYKKVAEIHVNAGYVPKNTDIDLFAQNCCAIAEPIIGLPANQISVGTLLTQLFKVTENFAMETQPQLLLLQKTMVVVEGIGQSLNPDINMWQLAEPWMSEWGAENLSVEAELLRIGRRLIKKLCEIV